MDIANSKKAKVAIMLATYNGELFLEEQLDSILQQTFTSWRLFIRDDNSCDKTPAIIKKYATRYADKIVVIDNSSDIRGTAKTNFGVIHRFVSEKNEFDYYMFCDQDDVWFPEKIEESVNALVQYEKNNPGPTLLHTDLTVVDCSLNVLSESYIRYRSINCQIKDLNHLLIQNNVTGCTMIWNSLLNDIVGDLCSDEIVMHDWWIALVACAFGHIVFFDKSLILYRQHKNNVVGATKVNSFNYIQRRVRDLNRVKRTLKVPFSQAKLFIERYSTTLSLSNKKILNAFISIPNRPKVHRLFLITRHKFFKQGLIQIIGEILLI